MSWNVLSNDIYNLINNSSDTLGLEEVSKYPKLTFKNYPVVTITLSDNENEFETTSENLRIYAWKVRVFYETKDTTIPDAIDALMPVVDDLMDKIDQENDAGTRTVGTNMPSRYTFINILATPGAWYTVEDGNIIYNEFTVRIKVSVSIY